jgi:nitroreductase
MSDDQSMDTSDAIRARRNVREYSDRPIPQQDLQRVLEAGRRAPSSQNWQPWNFVVVTDRNELQDLSKVWQGARHVAGSAATIALIGQDPADAQHRDRLQYDFGQTTANMMLAAVELGIGSGHSAVGDQAQAQRVLGFPHGYFCAYLIALGYPAGRPLKPIAKPNRRPFDEVVHWDRW